MSPRPLSELIAEWRESVKEHFQHSGKKQGVEACADELEQWSQAWWDQDKEAITLERIFGQPAK